MDRVQRNLKISDIGYSLFGKLSSVYRQDEMTVKAEIQCLHICIVDFQSEKML